MRETSSKAEDPQAVSPLAAVAVAGRCRKKMLGRRSRLLAVKSTQPRREPPLNANPPLAPAREALTAPAAVSAPWERRDMYTAVRPRRGLLERLGLRRT